MNTIQLLAIFVLVCGITLNSQSEDRPKAVRSQQSLSLRSEQEVKHIAQIVVALRRYAAVYSGKYPDRLQQLVENKFCDADELKAMTTSTLSEGRPTEDGCLVFSQGKDVNTAGNEVLVLGKNALPDGRKAVGLNDGSVTWLKRPQIDAFLKTVKK